MMIPIVQIKINKVSSFNLSTLHSIIKDGKLRVVTSIIKARIIPNCRPFASDTSVTGIIPNISAYIGILTNVAKITPKGLTQNNLNPAFWYPFVDNCTNPRTR